MNPSLRSGFFVARLGGHKVLVVTFRDPASSLLKAQLSSEHCLATRHRRVSPSSSLGGATKKNTPSKLRYFSWCDFTPKSEPISRISANSEPRRLSAERRTRPTSRPLCFFLRFPPAEFLFLAEKGLAGGSPTAGAVEAARLGRLKPPALRAFVLYI